MRGNNDKIDACHVTGKDSGVTYDFKDGTGFISSADGNKVLWNYDRDSRTLAIYSSDCSYTVDEKGNLYRNGEPVRVNGVWLNVIKGYNPEDTTEPPTEETTEPPTEEITDPPTEPPTTAKQNNLDKYLGTWSYSSKKQSYTCVWTFEKKGDTLYLIISGYGGGDKTTLPCTYELSEKSMKISCAALTATVTQAGDNRMEVVTDSDSAVLTR